jgi:hypothetical protein
MPAIVIRQVSVPLADLPPRAEGFRIAHLSDLHLRRWGRYEQHLQDILAHLPCDTLVITGDLGHHPAAHARTAELLSRLLAPVRMPLGVYGVLGNHDDTPLASHDLPMTVLRDEFRLIGAGAFEFHLGGIEQTVAHRSTVASALGPLPDDAPVVLMAHYPSTVFELPTGAGVLLLAGHTHGGQVRMPGIGCLWTNDRLTCAMARGLSQVRGNWLHVTAGTGVSGPLPVRLFCPPEITLLQLHRAARIEPGRRTLAPQATASAA